MPPKKAAVAIASGSFSFKRFKKKCILFTEKQNTDLV